MSSSYTYYAIRGIRRNIQEFEHSGTVFGAITRKQFEGLPIVEPDTSALTNFRSLITPIDRRIQLNEAESRKLCSIRDVLLPKLISGEIRVKNAENLVESVT